jgi:hypothetical protein
VENSRPKNYGNGKEKFQMRKEKTSEPEARKRKAEHAASVTL